MISTKYIIFIWIVSLIIFTFYCIFRLWYMSSTASFEDIIEPTKYDAISYINDLLKQDKIQNIPACASVYDDNVGIRILGYRSCKDAYQDYFIKGLDMNEKYGNSKSLSELCPESTKSPQYLQCMKNLLNKFTISANIVNGVNNDMSQSINQRLQERSDILNDIQLDMAPYLSNSDIKDFKIKTGAGLLSNSSKQTDELLRGISIYYKSKYGVSQSAFADISNTQSKQQLIQQQQTNQLQIKKPGEIIIDQYFANTFIGNYKPVKGQYLAFDNILISLDFELPIEIPSNTRTNSNTGSSNTGSSNTGSSNTGSSNTTSKDSNRKIVSNKGKLNLTITDNDTKALITYSIDKLEKYQEKQNAISLSISSQIINSNIVANTQTLQQLLYLLGLNIPTKIIMTIEIQKNDLGLEYRTYKILNQSLDTIMVLRRVS